SNDIPGLIAARIIIHIGIYLEDNDIGEVFADSTGFMVNGERYIPDASYLSYEKHPDVLGVAYRPDPPDLAIEVVSSERKSEQAILRVKIHNYLVAGTVVWVIDPYLRQVEIYRTGENTQVLSENAMLVEENLLPNFKLEISKLFKRLPE
ncbi:MAG: Uma2 family endonuclease, partial [Chloroflexota bacterium]